MAGNESTRFADGFMDDYFAEAEERLVSVRRNLLAVEQGLSADRAPAILEDLFRSFHSIKGISAMVELREAELVAHQMESLLRAVRQGKAALTAERVEGLVRGARLLDEIIGARRANRPLPSIDAFLEYCEGLFAEDERPAEASLTPSASGRATDGDAPVWLVSFVPTPALVERGVKVDTIRTRLLQLGNVLSVAPRVVPGGGISFEFEVQTRDEPQLAAWHDDGVSYVLHAGGQAPPEPASPGGAPGTRPDAAPLASASSHVVRVDLARLDELMRIVGDMVVTRARLEGTLQQVERHVPFQEWRALQEHGSRLERQLRDLREGVMRVRLVPVGEIFRRMPFVVRDLAQDYGKRVQLDLVGETTEIDKFLIERMMDPILHLVRNAISHAIEPPETRLAAGKPADGTIRLSASMAGESVVLQITDDGAGIDATAVAARARAAGMAVPEAGIDERALLDILCASGFSTRDEADRGSGRGVGLAVVRSTVEDLGGTLGFSTAAGRGTTFTITLPLTLAITDAIIATVGGQTFAIPQSTIREVIEVDAGALRTIEHNELLPYRGGTLPVVRLARLFGIATSPQPRMHAVVVGTGLAAVGLLVDRIGGQREVVVKAIADPLVRVDGVSGATELGDGRPVLMLDVAAISRSIRRHGGRLEELSA